MVIKHIFTNNWFDGIARANWDNLIPQIKPGRVLEIGSYEGASTCYLIEKIGGLQDLEIHCVDTWEGGIEHRPGGSAQTDMSEVEKRFRHNVAVSIDAAPHRINLCVHKGSSDLELSKLLSGGMQEKFDFVYVDGSHQAPDVLCDAVLGFRLLKKGGVMVFDDYLWQESLPNGVDPIRCPKLAVDFFTNIYCRQLRLIQAPLYQVYLQKVA